MRWRLGESFFWEKRRRTSWRTADESFLLLFCWFRRHLMWSVMYMCICDMDGRICERECADCVWWKTKRERERSIYWTMEGDKESRVMIKDLTYLSIFFPNFFFFFFSTVQKRRGGCIVYVFLHLSASATVYSFFTLTLLFFLFQSGFTENGLGTV